MYEDNWLESAYEERTELPYDYDDDSALDNERPWYDDFSEDDGDDAPYENDYLYE